MFALDILNDIKMEKDLPQFGDTRLHLFHLSVDKNIKRISGNPLGL